MRIYVINQLQGFRGYVDAEGIHIEKNNNLKLGINTRYIVLMSKLASEYSNMESIYAELCDRLEGDFASVWKYPIY